MAAISNQIEDNRGKGGAGLGIAAGSFNHMASIILEMTARYTSKYCQDPEYRDLFNAMREQVGGIKSSESA